MLSAIRIGKFTSSEIFNLMAVSKSNGRPLKAKETYIQEKIYEKRLGRQLNNALSSRPTIWGSTLEPRLYSLLDQFEYEYCSSSTIVHPTIPLWVGTPDFLTSRKVADGKCPYTLKSFCELADISISNDITRFKETKPEYYWQLVSNAVLTGKKLVELITYCPFQSELAAIRDHIENIDDNQNKLAWIYFSEDEDLPHLVEGEYYKNLYKFEFEPPVEDMALLTDAVLEASEILEAA